MTTEARMQEALEYAPGTFCWIELGTSDGEGAKKFYTELFEWDFTDNPIGPGMVYTMLKQDGKDVCALYQMPAEMQSQRIQPHWLSYISVSSADGTAEKVKQAGGELLKEPFDVFDLGRMAVVQDPTGGVFAVWQPGTHQGAGIVRVPNSFCWNELGTTQTREAGDFYTSVFGWTKHTQPVGSAEYTSFMNAEQPVGGMFKMPSDTVDKTPHWVVYFAVKNCEVMSAKAAALGAATITATTEIPGAGRFSVLRDPQGAVFGIIEFAH